MVRKKIPKIIKANEKFVLDCKTPVEDNIFDLPTLEKYLVDRIKIGGRTNQLKDKVKVTREKYKLVITSSVHFQKRYFKYLVRKYLKKQQLRDFLRVIACTKNGYDFRYFTTSEDVQE
eukprot:Trichotokara_eunicae@DN5510_c0_g1_i10.p1